MNGARDLLLSLMMLAIPLVAVRGLRGPPPLGPPRALADEDACEVPVELAGEGVVCLDEREARAARVRAGDRLRPEGGRLERGRMAPERLAEWQAPVDVNRASLGELASLDGIGVRLAERIAQARPFSTVDEVGRVKGVGRRRLERLRPRLQILKEVLDE
ncbi:MAG TPA: helix-hairpin-helix domain-containing protein [Polyangia bacterium]|nr:helix-hairpin-helix domain-containing protein [Polyangia bacterium]